MKSITEVIRAQSPAPRPQSIAFDGQQLWMGSIDTSRLYAIDPNQWSVREEVQAPGKPWGITVAGDELYAVCGEGADDDRFIRRFIPGHGFKSESIPCPENTGSQLGFDGSHLYVSQWYNKRLLRLDSHGKTLATFDLPREICGQVFADGAFYMLGTDDETTDRYYISRITLNGDAGTPQDLAHVPFPGRALAFDGSKFWTNHREAHEIVAFTLPE